VVAECWGTYSSDLEKVGSEGHTKFDDRLNPSLLDHSLLEGCTKVHLTVVSTIALVSTVWGIPHVPAGLALSTT
jgi:hypothetical protein